MIRTAIISVVASFVLVGAWTVSLVSYHPTTARMLTDHPMMTGREMVTLVMALVSNWLI